jgi:hypothetical protein
MACRGWYATLSTVWSPSLGSKIYSNEASLSVHWATCAIVCCAPHAAVCRSARAAPPTPCITLLVPVSECMPLSSSECNTATVIPVPERCTGQSLKPFALNQIYFESNFKINSAALISSQNPFHFSPASRHPPPPPGS